MILHRFIWAALVTATVVGSVQTGIQQWRAAPLILAAEVYEDQKSSVPLAAQMQVTHSTAETQSSPEHGHDESGQAWSPQNGIERAGWTWVANFLHSFSMALLVFAVMGAWLHSRGTTVTSLRLASVVAAAGWLSFHFWPSLGLHAEIPGMDAAPLTARQIWWGVAVGSAASACAVASWGRTGWRWLLSAALLVFPFFIGAPELQGNSLTGFSSDAHAALVQIGKKFIWVTHWLALMFWIAMGVVGGWTFHRWVRPNLQSLLNPNEYEEARSSNAIQP